MFSGISALFSSHSAPIQDEFMQLLDAIDYRVLEQKFVNSTPLGSIVFQTGERFCIWNHSVNSKPDALSVRLLMNELHLTLDQAQALLIKSCSCWSTKVVAWIKMHVPRFFAFAWAVQASTPLTMRQIQQCKMYVEHQATITGDNRMLLPLNRIENLENKLQESSMPSSVENNTLHSEDPIDVENLKLMNFDPKEINDFQPTNFQPTIIENSSPALPDANVSIISHQDEEVARPCLLNNLSDSDRNQLVSFLPPSQKLENDSALTSPHTQSQLMSKADHLPIDEIEKGEQQQQVQDLSQQQNEELETEQQQSSVVQSSLDSLCLDEEPSIQQPKPFAVLSSVDFQERKEFSISNEVSVNLTSQHLYSLAQGLSDPSWKTQIEQMIKLIEEFDASVQVFEANWAHSFTETLATRIGFKKEFQEYKDQLLLTAQTFKKRIIEMQEAANCLANKKELDPEKAKRCYVLFPNGCSAADYKKLLLNTSNLQDVEQLLLEGCGIIDCLEQKVGMLAEWVQHAELEDCYGFIEAYQSSILFYQHEINKLEAAKALGVQQAQYFQSVGPDPLVIYHSDCVNQAKARMENYAQSRYTGRLDLISPRLKRFENSRVQVQSDS